ncbi:hypothetical protein KR215_009734 [Drosophila sulfurigaster]|nr:hypothetical protein KR215_009734 [Drosophila sulfurigaster]
MSWLAIAIALFCSITVAESVCCKEAMVINYNVTGEPCDEVGGKDSNHGCIIKICANGKAMKPTDHFCGKGPCDTDGCQCEGGCHVGYWETTFLQIHEDYNIIIIDMRWEDLAFSYSSALSGSIDYVKNVF